MIIPEVVVLVVVMVVVVVVSLKITVLKMIVVVVKHWLVFTLGLIFSHTIFLLNWSSW